MINNIFNKTESAIFHMQYMLLKDSSIFSD